MTNVLQFVFDVAARVVQNEIFQYSVLPIFALSILVMIIGVIKSICIR